MRAHCGRHARASFIAAAVLIATAALDGERVTVRYPEGLVHGFLALRTLDGTTIADGDLTQVAQGSRVTARATFRFKDGSLQEETAVFSQDGRFRLLDEHLVQKGPSFPRPMDLSIDTSSGTVKVRYTDDGQEHAETEHMDLPPDLSNGIIPVLLKNIIGETPPKSFSFVAATPRPRLITLLIKAEGPEPFATDGKKRVATHYVLTPHIGGFLGLLAPLAGKQPPDSHVWILGGEAPAFVKSEQQLYVGGPVWRIELVAPRPDR
jgi:hypothetical protein